MYVMSSLYEDTDFTNYMNSNFLKNGQTQFGVIRKIIVIQFF